MVSMINKFVKFVVYAFFFFCIPVLASEVDLEMASHPDSYVGIHWRYMQRAAMFGTLSVVTGLASGVYVGQFLSNPEDVSSLWKAGSWLSVAYANFGVSAYSLLKGCNYGHEGEELALEKKKD